jgi:RNA polymerase sigma-70 factor (ECF subfamily)
MRKAGFMNEFTLIQAAQAGQLEAFNTLVLSHQDSAYNLAYRILGDEVLAEDATQVAFISAFRNLTSFRGGSFRAWLSRIVTNACYDELRRQKSHPTQPLIPEDEYGDDIENVHWLLDQSADLETHSDDMALEQAIQHGLNALPADFRAVLVLSDIQGMDYSEIAAIVRAPIGTVKSRLARARKRLRSHLQQYAYLLPDFCRSTGSEHLPAYSVKVEPSHSWASL